MKLSTALLSLSPVILLSPLSVVWVYSRCSEILITGSEILVCDKYTSMHGGNGALGFLIVVANVAAIAVFLLGIFTKAEGK